MIAFLYSIMVYTTSHIKSERRWINESKEVLKIKDPLWQNNKDGLIKVVEEQQGYDYDADSVYKFRIVCWT